MLPENRAFWIRGDDGQEYGPVAMDELREWVQENRAGLGTEVRLDESGSAWRSWQSYPELVALLAGIQGTAEVLGPPGTVLAPIWRRILAGVIDLVLTYFLALPILGVMMTLSLPDWETQALQVFLQPGTPMSPQFLHYAVICDGIFYLILTLYFAGFHAAHGQTPAKAILRLRVVDQNGQKPPFLKTFLRGLIFVASLYFYGLPFFYAFFNPQRRTVHDFIAGTFVVNA